MHRPAIVVTRPEGIEPKDQLTPARDDAVTVCSRAYHDVVSPSRGRPLWSVVDTGVVVGTAIARVERET